jgi:hypothetical protein
MGLFSKIFGRKLERADVVMSAQRAAEIINKFGFVLENEAPAPGCIADVSKLPFPKEKIRQALIVGLRTNADPKMKEMLKVAYVELANWQADVGSNDQGLDTSKLTLKGDVEGLARAVLKQTECQNEWNETVLKEQASSRSELEQLGLWQ